MRPHSAALRLTPRPADPYAEGMHTLTSDRRAFKASVRSHWDAAARGWDAHSPEIRAWLRTATDAMIALAGGMLFWLAGYKYTSASVASVLNETASIFILLFAWLLLKEPLGRRKLAGVACTFCGGRAGSLSGKQYAA